MMRHFAVQLNCSKKLKEILYTVKVYPLLFCTGLEPGTVVISEAAVDGLLRPYMEVVCDI